MSEAARREMQRRLLLPLQGEEGVRFYTHAGTHVATGYVRVVVGDRGPYIEFDPKQIVRAAFFVPEDERYRLSYPGVYYNELRSRDEAYVKLYHQKKTVAYADYQVGMLYISPLDLRTDERAVLYLEEQPGPQMDFWSLDEGR